MADDARGLPVTAGGPDAVAHLDATVAAFARFGRDTGEHLKRALRSDPELVLGHCARGYFLKMFAMPRLEEKAMRSLEAAQASCTVRGASRREMQHVRALAAWLTGDMSAAARRIEILLVDHPRDLLALKIGHYLHFYLGDSRQLRDSLARVRHAWDPAVPGYGHFLGLEAFALEECGDYDKAERRGREALDVDPVDPWAVHAVAHVLEMQDRRREGIDWLRDREADWSGCNNFAFHLWWHLALAHLDRGEVDEVLALYDRAIRAEPSDEYLDLCNAISLLWRLEDQGVAVGERWEGLAASCEPRIGEHLLVFADLHFLLALAAGGRLAQAQAMLDSLENLAIEGRGTAAEVIRSVGLGVGRGILAWYRGDFPGVLAAILPVRYRLAAVGGSHAQRDLFDRMVVGAALRSRHHALARALLSERLALRPDNVWGWQRHAELLSETGDETGADAARERARSLLAG
jgi:tetratricopeptide (TPR) repeat protein